MTNHNTRRRYRISTDRRVWLCRKFDNDLEPEPLAKMLLAAELEQARREQEARTESYTTLIADVDKEGHDGDGGELARG